MLLLFLLFCAATSPPIIAPSFGKALVEFVVSADGSSCGARLIYAAGPEAHNVVDYEPIESSDFKEWIMGRMNAFVKRITGKATKKKMKRRRKRRKPVETKPGPVQAKP